MALHRRRYNHNPNRFGVSLPKPQALHRTHHPSGFFVFPDVPSRKKPRFLQASEHALARRRLDGLTAPPQAKLSRSIFPLLPPLPPLSLIPLLVMLPRR